MSRKACDRCHRLKEQCTPAHPSAACTRCIRLHIPCTHTRALPRRGRRPKLLAYATGAAIAVWDSNTAPTHNPTNEGEIAPPRAPTPPCSRAPSPRTSAPAAPANILSLFPLIFAGLPYQATPELSAAFYGTFAQFLLGPTFAAPVRMAAMRAFFAAPDMLARIYGAIEVVMGRACAVEKRGDGKGTETRGAKAADSATVRSGVVALETLRTVEVSDCDAALGMLALGQVLAAFDLLMGEGGVVLILRHALVAAEPWYDELVLDSTLDSLTVSTVFWELVCALARNEVPAVRPRVRSGCFVDRLAGLCTGLMPLLYELAVAVAEITDSREDGVNCPDMTALRQIEDEIASWAPSVPENFESTYRGEEKVRMRAQASMYRNAALLVVRRAQHPLLSEDELARRIASDILSDYARHEDLLECSDEGRLRHVAFPLLLAAYELRDEASMCLKRLEVLQIAPTCRRNMLLFVDHVWAVRAKGRPTYLSEVVRSERALLAPVP